MGSEERIMRTMMMIKLVMIGNRRAWNMFSPFNSLKHINSKNK